jgi:FtsZ-binding cell division protein ZapB
MINLEQVKLLESKVAKAIDYVERLTKENTALRRQEAEWQKKMESYQKRIDELEILVTGFKEDQGRIEEGILAALDRLSQFEKAIEKSLRENKPAKKTADAESGDGQTCFEIPESAAPDGAPAPEAPSGDGGDIPADAEPPKEDGELDIF